MNIYGEVIGINSVIRRSDNAPAAEAVKAGAGFAIPINLVKKISDQLVTNRKVIRGWLGIRMMEVPEGIRVRSVSQSSPAAHGGLQRNDIITKYHGEKVQSTRRFQFLIAESRVGEKAEIIVLRHGERKILEVAIGEMPPRLVGKSVEPKSESWKRLGIVTRELGEHDFEHYIYLSPGDQGVMVKDVKLGAPAPSAGIPRGALITAINGRKIKSVEEFDEVLKGALDAPEIAFEIAYGEGKEVISVKPDQE